jgi:DNA-binding helix-hairpin-helix protein with protein kinase domain
MRNFTRSTDGAVTQGRKLLGAGGQGEVWQATLDGKDVAVKVYHRHTATGSQRAVIERLVKAGPPAPYFLWPLACVEDPSMGSFGYAMALREPRFRASEDFMARRIEPSFRALMTAAWQLSDGFLRLHSAGHCYRDISFGNVFLDPNTGDIRICDNDNVDIVGSATGGVLGTPRFMAPEVVRREAAPSDQTDRYSLAVLLFYLLMGGHPLDGAREAKIRCLDVPALEKLYGFEPLYVFDPADLSNRPVPGVHPNPLAFEHLYPTSIRAHFERSFTEGLHYPNKRVRESEWRKVFSRARDSILYCGACGAENFYDAERLRSTGAQGCWSCAATLVIPPRIRIGADVVLLNRDTRLYNHHLGSPSGTEVVVAEVVPNPRDPSLFGLKNLTSETWTVTKPDATVMDVPPGRAAPIISGNVVNFGPVTGEVRV